MAGTLSYGAEVRYDQLFSEDHEAADGAREIKACLAAGETSNALLVCDRMLSLRPDNRLFEGLKLEAENKEREIRLEFIRRLSSELESVPDLDARINAIQEALVRYPAESQLTQLLSNATARRDLLHTVIAEARNEELSERYAEALKQWYLIRELFPAMPGLENEILRVESLADIQRRLRRRAEFVEAIFRLSSTGDYTRAVYQCMNALAEYPNDGGLLSLKQSIEEKAQHSTELQTAISEGLTFLQNHEADAALESFVKARNLDQSNLQVRYLIGIALLEKARVVMSNDRRKLNVLLDEAKSFMPNHPELQTLSFELEGLPGENWDRSLARGDHSGTDLQPSAVQPSTAAPEAAMPSPQPSAPDRETDAKPVAPRSHGFFRNIAPFGLLLLGVFISGWLVSMVRLSAGSSVVIPPPSTINIRAAQEGAEIFVDDRKVEDSQVQTQLAGDDSQSIPVESGSEPKALQTGVRPALLDLHIVTDQPGGAVWIDDQMKGNLAEGDITISGVEPGVRIIKVGAPTGDIELSFEFSPGKIPTLTSLPSRQFADVLFAGSAGGKSRVECNCSPAGLKVGGLAEMMLQAGGLEVTLLEGQYPAELWVGKNHRKLTIHGSRVPVATIAVFSSIDTAPSVANWQIE